MECFSLCGVLRLFVACTALGISVFIGERFLLTLLLQYLVCCAFNHTNNRSLLLAITIGGVIFVSLTTLYTVFPTTWHQWHNILYFFPITNFLLHYFVFCILEFNLTDMDPQLMVIFMYTTLPSLCCLILSWIVSNFMGIQLSVLLALCGFSVLMWCLSRRNCFLISCSGKQNYSTLWNNCAQLCILLLLELFPLGAHFVHLYANWSSASLVIQLMLTVVLFCGTQFLSSVAREFGKLEFCASRRRSVFGCIAVVCTGLLLLHYTNLWNLKYSAPTELSYLALFVLLFSLLLGYSFCQLRTKTSSIASSRISLASVAIGVLLFLCCVATTQRIPRGFVVGGWATGRLGFLLPICTIFSILPIIVHRHFGSEMLEGISIIFLLAFYTLEWKLFQAVLINEVLFMSSTVAMGIFILIFHLTKTNPKHHRDPTLADAGFLSSDFINLCILTPSLTKTLLLGLNRLDYSERSLFLVSSVSRQRIRYEKGAILGIYMTIFGLLSGSRIVRVFRKYAGRLIIRACKRLAVHNETVEHIFGQIGLFMYFNFSISLFWSSVVRMLFGMELSSYIAFQFALLLTGLSLYLAPPRRSRMQSSQGDAEYANGRHYIVAAVFLLGSTVLLGRVLAVDLVLLILLLGIPTATYILVCVAFSIVLKQERLWMLYRYTWIISSLEWGMLLGIVLSPLFVWMDFTLFSVPQLFWSVLYSTCLYLLLQAQLSNSLQDVIKPNQLDPLPTLSSQLDESNSLQMTLFRTRTRFMLINLLFGIVSLFGVFGCQLLVNKEYVNWNGQLPNLVFLALFVLGQLAADRMNTRSFRSRASKRCSRKPSQKHIVHSTPCAERLVLHSVINTTVIVVLIAILQHCSWDYTDLRLLFLPWLLFGLVGAPFERNSKLVPLVAFTLLLLASMTVQSHFTESFNPPVPTFTKRLFRASYSRWFRWGEALLTLSLIPIHLLFLLHQANVSTLQLASWILPTSRLEKWVPLLAHGLSHVCASVSWTTYGLTLFCLLYIFLASSVAAAVFGLYSFFVCCYTIMWIDIRLQLDSLYAF